MTASLCLHCATLKDGPWAPCPNCAFQPNDPDDMAKAMILSEEKYTREELEEMRGWHQRGEAWSVDPVLVEQCRARLGRVGMVSLTANSREKPPAEIKPEEGAGDFLLNRVFVPMSIIGVPLIPLSSIGRAAFTLITWGSDSCREETAWIIGLFAYLLFFGGIILLIMRF